MSQLETIRAVLAERTGIVVTETSKTAFPSRLNECSESDVRASEWTHRVIFTIVLLRNELDIYGYQRRAYLGSIARNIPYRAASSSPDRKIYREAIGKIQEQHITSIQIDDPLVPLSDDFVESVQTGTITNRRTAWREIELQVCEYGFAIGSMTGSVERGRSSWLHAPDQQYQ